MMHGAMQVHADTSHNCACTSAISCELTLLKNAIVLVTQGQAGDKDSGYCVAARELTGTFAREKSRQHVRA